MKLTCFVKRHPNLGVDEFHERWREHHGPLVAETLGDRIVRYEQNHRLARDYERPDSGDFDGVAIQWFDSIDDFAGMVASPEYAARVAPDEDELLDRNGLIWLLTEPEEVFIPGPECRDGRMAKLVCLVKRNVRLEVDEFHRQWREVHGPLNRDTPAIARHFIRYEQNHRLARDYTRPGGPDFDGVAIEWFASPRAFWAMVAEPDWAEVIAPHEREFLDLPGLVWLLTGKEEFVIGAP
jgi:uncharacterized protein (TIGR02118 family)